MRRTPVYDPRYIRHVMPTANGLASLARCAVYRATADRPEWVAGVGNTTSGMVQIWAGPCRIQPIIDIRARPLDYVGEYDAAQAIRFNLPFERNEFGATLNSDGTVQTYAPDPEFAFGDMIDVTEVFFPGQDMLLPKRFTVRNALVSTTMFQFDLLCDVGTSMYG